jgi:hypothetical protein
MPPLGLEVKQAQRKRARTLLRHEPDKRQPKHNAIYRAQELLV